MSYCSLFWGSIEIYKEYDSLYILERNDNFFCHFCVYGHFRELLPTVLGSGVIYKAHDTQYMFERHDQKLIVFAFSCRFPSYCPLGFRGDLQGI
jgi:hypothetical protein